MRHTRGEKRIRKDREGRSEQKAQEIIGQTLLADIEMFAKRVTGDDRGLPDIHQLNKGRGFPLDPPYKDWTISFFPEEDTENFSSGYFALGCPTFELNRYVELRGDAEKLAKIILEQPEIQRFSIAIIEGLKKIVAEFNDDFERKLKALPEGEQPGVRVLAARDMEIIRLKRVIRESAADLHGSRGAFPFETSFGTSVVRKAEKRLQSAIS